MEKLIVASNNKGKIVEIKAILSDMYDVRSLREENIVSDPEETGKTFIENALIKARSVHALTGVATLADDSGLVVDALDGAPGVLSARYAGEHGKDEDNNDLLLKNLEGITNRRARFVCAAALIKSSGEEIVAEGSTEGEILLAADGTKGFGYDPLFYSYDLNKSFGQASAEEKNGVSHRARALKSLAEKVRV